MSDNLGKTLITKTAYITGSRCRYATYLYTVKRHLAKAPKNEMVLLSGKEVEAKAESYMNVTYSVDFSENRETMIADTENAIKAGHKRIGKACFIYEEMFCSVDIFYINEDGSVTIYEVKSGTDVKEVDKQDCAYQYVVLSGLGYNIRDVFIMHANGDYFFSKNESIDYSKFYVTTSVLEDCIDLRPIVNRDVSKVFDALKTGVAPEHDFSSSCNTPHQCPFFDYCISEAGLPSDSNIFCITGPHFTPTKLNKWYFNDIKTYEDLVEKVEVTYKKDGQPKDASWKYIQQAQSYLDKKDPPVKMEELGEFLDKIEFPLASFDYEGFSTSIPRFYELKTSQQVVFQFSYDYIESEGAERQHYEFLAEPGTDPREAICNALAKLPLANTILVWNDTYEKSRNKEMAQLTGFEEFREMLLEMCDNMVDMQVPFRNRIVYPWKVNGSWGLKKVTDAMLPTLTYRDLKIQNGTEAAEKFMALPKMREADRKTTILALKFYNNQDVLGPLLILQQLYRIYKEDDEYILFTDKTQKDMLGQEIHIGDSVSCDKGIAVITKFTGKYVVLMLMLSGTEVRRMGKSLVLIQEYFTDKPRNVETRFGKLVRGDVVACNRGIGKVFGFTKHFVRIKLTGGYEILRMRHKINKIQDAPEKPEI